MLQYKYCADTVMSNSQLIGSYKVKSIHNKFSKFCQIN